ncbi:hypothetical protein HW932_19140 [Allochromatium humboldtianum]|uniref:SF3 helicase domain-containing protein n=1 Tax=Allochromatium humboldtianum TaxID=504901 RepID=A0A850R9G3_9GAMM|nr:phage/plasmid primase, P4 family [Allochromatium humboldtianum]NVZ11369.1 hypothetical protein [Allochromatium humboldtianum]
MNTAINEAIRASIQFQAPPDSQANHCPTDADMVRDLMAQGIIQGVIADEIGLHSAQVGRLLKSTRRSNFKDSQKSERLRAFYQERCSNAPTLFAVAVETEAEPVTEPLEPVEDPTPTSIQYGHGEEQPEPTEDPPIEVQGEGEPVVGEPVAEQPEPVAEPAPVAIEQKAAPVVEQPEQTEEPTIDAQVEVDPDAEDVADIADVGEQEGETLDEPEPDIFAKAVDPVAEDLRCAVETINKAIEQQPSDAGAVFEDEVKAAWNTVYDANHAEYMRLKDAAKKAGASKVEIEKICGIRNKRVSGKKKTEKIFSSSTSSTSSTDKGSSDTQSYTELFESSTSSTEPLPPKPKALVRESEKGPRLEIASDAALIVSGVLKGRFAYCTTAETWHGFTGTHWEPLPSPAPLYEALTRWMFPATQDVGFTPRYQDSILTVIQRAGMRSLPKAPNAIPFANGLLDIETGTLSPITPTNAATWALPYEYQPGADCPRVKAWLLQAVGEDRDVVELLRAFLAALIRGGAYLQRFLHLIGPGGTGKSTFLRLIEALIGTRNAVTTDLKELEQNRFESAALYGKRAALITDSDRYGGSVNKLKAITGQDPVRLERKHVQQSGSFIFEGMVFLASNEPLATTDYTSGIERRRVTIHFERRVSEQEKAAWNAAGGEKAVLHAELPGVVNWLLSMPVVEMERRIRHPPEHTIKANIEAMCSGNPCADWLTECCVPDSDAWTQVGECEERRSPDDGEVYYLHADTRLFPSYLMWCKKSGRVPLSLRRFRSVVLDAIKTLGFDAMDIRRAEGRGIKGVRLRHSGEEPFSWHSSTQSDTSGTKPTPTNTAPSRANVGGAGSDASSDHIPPAPSRANIHDDCADSEYF